MSDSEKFSETRKKPETPQNQGGNGGSGGNGRPPSTIFHEQRSEKPDHHTMIEPRPPIIHRIVHKDQE